MNILNFLIKEKHVAGVEISDQMIRVAYFRPKKIFGGKKGIVEHELVLIEEGLAANIVKEGVVRDTESLSKTLKDVWTGAKLGAYYAIVAIPENKIYSHIFPFPKTVSKTELEEAIRLAISFQFPMKKSDMYVGYENAGDSHLINEVLISAIPKTIANDYILALNHAGIRVLALESHLASIARAIKLKLGLAALFIKKSLDGATIFIVKDGSLRFSRTLPATFIKGDNLLEKETQNIKTSFESEKKITLEELPLAEAKIRDEYLKYTEIKESDLALQSKWLIAIGAAIRGEIPKGQDNRISLLPIGTAEAYAYQKTTAFIALIRNITIGVSIFFLFTFLAAYLFIFSLSQTANGMNSNIPISPVSPDTLANEALVQRTNLMVQAGNIILSTTPDWSILLDDINAHVIDGIIITNFSVTSINDPISITGTAKDRNTLNEFKKSLQASTYLTAVELPINNLEQKGDIPFTISFQLVNPEMLYYK